MNGIMVYVVIKFYTTKNDPGAGRSTPWADSPVLWPTWMLLLASGVTFVVTAFALSAACCAKSKAEGGRGKTIWFTVLKYAVHVIVWLAVAALYKIQKKDRDLWGWSCGNEAAEIQYAFNTKLNFSFLCNIQVGPASIIRVIGFSRLERLLTCDWITDKLVVLLNGRGCREGYICLWPLLRISKEGETCGLEVSGKSGRNRGRPNQSLMNLSIL
jgi:hypothetical protein